MAGIKIEVAFDEEKFEKTIEKIKADNPDFLEVVRCKDCKFSGKSQNNRICSAFESEHRICDDDYCSYGERRDEG